MDEARLALIVGAIQALEPKDFTKAGPPKIAAVKTTIPDITAEELAIAWDTIKPAPDETTEKTVTFDTEGATHCVTIRNGKAVKVWFRDGKEIGVEDVGE